MRYNFDKIIDRSQTDCYKWDVNENELPMWIADMDFEVAPCIQRALQKRLSHPVFGYTYIPKEWNAAYINWWQRRHEYTMEEDWLLFTTGVMPALSSIIRTLTAPKDNILIQTPVYNMFFNEIENNGRKIIENPLVYDGTRYYMDLKDLEEKLENPKTTMMILCNPHNPIGKIWNERILVDVAKLCKKHGVVIVSDEIHCDITNPNKSYVPFVSVSQEAKDNSVTLVAPTKCFNIASLQTAAVVVPNPILRQQIEAGLHRDEISEPNCFAAPVTIAAFNEGEAWLNEMCMYVQENKNIVSDFIQTHIHQIRVVKSDATYLLWLDCSNLKGTSKEICAYIRKETGLFLSDGEQYGESGKHFIRMNVACPKELLSDGLHRLQLAIEMYIKK